MTHNTVIVGYKYHLGMHLVLCRGPVTELQELRIGGRSAHQGTITADNTGFDSVNVTSIQNINTPRGFNQRTGTGPYDRIDRIVLDLDTLLTKIVFGNESTGTPVAPSTPGGTVSLATITWTANTSSTSTTWSLIVDNSQRDDANFGSASDCQVSVNPSITSSQTDISITSGQIISSLVAGDLFINKPELFGGEKRGGGVLGPVDVEIGDANQKKNGYLTARLGDVPAYRNVVSLIARQVYIGTAPSVRPWAVTCKRVLPVWDTGGSMIGEDANPAVIIYELLTNKEYGLGFSEGDLDLTSFTTARNELATEGFGLSFLWTDDKSSVEDFITDVLRYVDGSLYVDPGTGQWRLKMHRVSAAVATLDDSNVVAVNNFSRPSWADLTNTVTITYTDGDGTFPSWKKQAISQQNLAMLASQGNRMIEQRFDYPAIMTHALANRVLARDLNQSSQPLAKVDLTLTAAMNTLRPGDSVDWIDDDYGVTSLPLRIIEIDYGTVNDGSITAICVEDIFRLDQGVFDTPSSTDWVDPIVEPVAITTRKLREATYLQVVGEIGEDDAEALDATETFLTVAARREQGTAITYEVWSDETGSFKKLGRSSFTPYAKLASTIIPTTNVIYLAFDEIVDLDEVEIGSPAYMGDELVEIVTVDVDNNLVTVNRGILDTTPQVHLQGTEVYFEGGGEFQSLEPFVDTDNINVKLLPITTLGTLDLSAAPQDNFVFVGRQSRPFPPGNVLLELESYPFVLQALQPLDLTWAHRDRLTQTTDTFVLQSAGDIGPEAGTTYTLRIYDENDTLLRTETGLSGTSYSYTEANENADGGPFNGLRFELESVRDGLVSHQLQEIGFVALYGYGRRYGEEYGGLA